MNPADFGPNAPGRLIPTIEGQFAFVPSPLPPALIYDQEMTALSAKAEYSLGELAGIGKRFPDAQILGAPFIRREAVASTRIEGTTATEEEVLVFEANPHGMTLSPDIQEVLNYRQAIEMGVTTLREVPFSRRLLRTVHKRLLLRGRGAAKRPGEFRTTQVYIGDAGQPIREARYIPPPPEEMDAALDALEKFMQPQYEDIPLLIKLALFHYQFEAIHPFADGNGRVGRLMIPLLLVNEEKLPSPLLYLSSHFERNRQAYMDHLLAVSQRGSWREWITFFLEGVAAQAEDAISRATELLALRDAWRGKLQKARGSTLTLQLMDNLFENPVTTVSRARGRLQVSFPTAKRHIEKLIQAGILRDDPKRKRDRLYRAPAILKIINRP